MDTLRRHISHWWQRAFVQEKLQNKTGWMLLLLGAAVTSVAIAWGGILPGIGLVGLFFGVPIVILCLVHLRFGLICALVLAFTIGLLDKYTSFPVGTALDGLLFLLLFGMMVTVSQRKDWEMPRNPITVMVLVWIAYCFLQVINPEAPSRAAWVYTVRSFAVLHLFYFVAYYALRSYRHIKILLKIIIGLAAISALYGLKQEFFGYSSREWAWLYEHPKRYQLIVQWGRYRVFSIFSDPTTFGTLMAYCGSFCLVLATGPFRQIWRILLVVGGLAMFMAMAYAGSRTPFILIPAAMGLYALLNMSPKVLLVTGMLTILGTGMIMKSTSNPVIFRIQSAFRPTSDASVKVRLQNQRMIQPYIQTHPIGAGLGTTGIWGERFSPHFWLAGFAHDSAYVRMAVETGWLGLLIYMALLFSAFQLAIHYYFRVRHPQIKIIYLGLAIVIFILGMANYPQEVVTLLPNSIIFYLLLAVIARLWQFDRDIQVDKEQPSVSPTNQSDIL